MCAEKPSAFAEAHGGLGGRGCCRHSDAALRSAVTAFIDAVNSHEISAVEAAQTPDNAWLSVTNGVMISGPYSGEVLVAYVEPDWLYSELQLTTAGAPLVVSDSQVVVPTHATFNPAKALSRITIPPFGSGAVTYTVRDDGSGLKVASVFSVMTGSNG